MVNREIISPKTLPAAAAPISPAVRVDNTIYISGQLGKDGSGKLLNGVTNQTHQSLKNIGEVLKAAGVGYENVVKTTILLKDLKDYAVVNNIYKEYFTKNFPARACYQVAELPGNGLVEIEGVAVAGHINEVKSKL